MLIPIQREEQGHAKCVERREVEQTRWITLRLIILLGSLFPAVFVESFSVREIRWQNTNPDITGIDKRICNVCGTIFSSLSFRVYEGDWQGVGWPKSTRNISINSEIQPFHCSPKRTIEIMFSIFIIMIIIIVPSIIIFQNTALFSTFLRLSVRPPSQAWYLNFPQ